MKTFFKKCIIVLGFVFFFALFSAGNPAITAFSKEVTESSDTQPETQAEIKLNVKTKALVKDTKYTLKVYNLSGNQKASFKSSDSSIASVDEEGVVCGIANGTAVITVTVKDGLKTVASLTCEVTVGPPAISVKWTKSEIVLAVGKRMTLKTILLPYNTAEAVKFYSSDTEIATVTSTGKITAKSEGDTYVFAMIDNGKFDFCKVTVVDQDTYDQLIELPENGDATNETEDTANEKEGEATPAPTKTPSPSTEPTPTPSTPISNE